MTAMGPPDHPRGQIISRYPYPLGWLEAEKRGVRIPTSKEI